MPLWKYAVQVSDTTKMSRAAKAGKQKIKCA